MTFLGKTFYLKTAVKVIEKEVLLHFPWTVVINRKILKLGLKKSNRILQIIKVLCAAMSPFSSECGIKEQICNKEEIRLKKKEGSIRSVITWLCFYHYTCFYGSTFPSGFSSIQHQIRSAFNSLTENSLSILSSGHLITSLSSSRICLCRFSSAFP